MVRESTLAYFLGASSALLFLPGSSDGDEDGVSAATFLKKKSETPSGESRKFLKKMEVRGRVTVRVIYLPWAILGPLGKRTLELGRVGFNGF